VKRNCVEGNVISREAPVAATFAACCGQSYVTGRRGTRGGYAVGELRLSNLIITMSGVLPYAEISVDGGGLRVVSLPRNPFGEGSNRHATINVIGCLGRIGICHDRSVSIQQKMRKNHQISHIFHKKIPPNSPQRRNQQNKQTIQFRCFPQKEHFSKNFVFLHSSPNFQNRRIQENEKIIRFFVFSTKKITSRTILFGHI
jgi:hypothetical protein